MSANKVKSYSHRAPRIRWNAQESLTVLRGYAELRSTHPEWSCRQALESAQEPLPAMRRRPVYPSLTSWANREVPNLPVPAPESLVANTGLANAGFGDSAPDGSEEVIDAVVRYGVRAGASLVSGILRDPDVQRALLALITDVARQLMLPGGRTQESAAMDSGSSLPTVAVVGLSDAQAAEVSRAYRGVLRVLFDKGDSAASPTLRGVLADAQLVVVMDGTVSSEVMRMLRQETPRFVRHTTGLSGLRKRLADLVMDQTAQGVSSARISASRA